MEPSTLAVVKVMTLCDKECKLVHLHLETQNKHRIQKHSLPACKMLLRAKEHVYC